MNQSLKDLVVARLLPRVQMPGQYVGGELNAVVKDPGSVRGKFCFAFPDTYSIGMSNHGLQVLYQAINRRSDWACERAFAPGIDMERLLREHKLPLYSLETFTPLGEFDVVGFSLQHELCYSNVLTMLDLGGIPLVAADRDLSHPLVIAGGPSVQNPEPMSRFIDLFVLGDGEESLPAVCEAWISVRSSTADRPAALAAMALRFPFVYVPCCYRPNDEPGGGGLPIPIVEGAPTTIVPAIVADLDAMPLPTAPIVPLVECVQDRIAIEIMRGCPWRCRFCQSTTTKRPLRFRSVETILAAALESYRNTGYDELSLLSLSTSDYPHFAELLPRLYEMLRPLGVAISVPSLRVNEQLRTLGDALSTERHSGLTLAPEAARDEMRRRIGKQITNDDLYAGCRTAFQNGFNRVKLYFMCGLPGEQPDDLDGMLDMAETISRIGKEERGRMATVVVNVSNFVPKPHTPFQWNAMQRREYFHEAHQQLKRRRNLRTVEVKCHDVESSLLEAVLARGDRRVGRAIELAWRQGARFDSWNEHSRPQLWWSALAEAGIDVDTILHQPRAVEDRLPWDHVAIRQGRSYLEHEQEQSQAPVDGPECGG
jgi:radical SAM family uncharacterized protein